MNRSDAITLVATKVETDAIGNQTDTETGRVTVYGDVYSVSREENDAAGSHGYSEVQKLVVYPWDYTGEKYVIVGGKKKVVYRTYQAAPDTLELYAASRKGVKL